VPVQAARCRISVRDLAAIFAFHSLAFASYPLPGLVKIRAKLRWPAVVVPLTSIWLDPPEPRSVDGLQGRVGRIVAQTSGA